MAVLEDREWLWLSKKTERIIMNWYLAFSVEQVCFLLHLVIDFEVYSACLKVFYNIFRINFIKVNVAL